MPNPDHNGDHAAAHGVVPAPRGWERRPGAFVFDRDVRIIADGAAADAAWLLHDTLRSGLGLRTPVAGGAPGPGRAVTLRLDPGGVPAAEGYLLDVTPDAVDLVAATPAGLHWGVQTLRQLLPPDALRSAPAAGVRGEIPCCRVADEPRFPWRGVMLDVARHHMPTDFVLRLIDLAALHKLNRLHLHLTDDQGWRLEVPGWPRLTEHGGWRAETVRGPAASPKGYDGTPHGGFYSLAALREIVAHAAARQITVVPEVGLPGHVQAAVAAYPELGNGGRPPVRTRWGGSTRTLGPGPETSRFLDDVLTTVLDVFPSPHVHLGGDECLPDEWRASPRARAFAARAGLPSVDGLASWFLRSLAGRLTEAGRRTVVWDQALEGGGAPAGTVAAIWRDWTADDLAARALAAGHDVINCPTRTTYLDHYQSDHPGEPVAFPEVTSLDDVVAFDPAPAALIAAGGGRARVLGTQAQLWTEHLTSPRQVEYMAFPRLGALAEAAWSAPETRAAHPFGSRLPEYLARLDALSVEYRPPGGPRPWQRGGTGDRARPAPGGPSAAGPAD
ncbi:beta-N-acetylhexosaminidase [Streptomyces sp. NPDC014894]|uniref:beta-N-acetylhexosaminidase n=1 Tax=unclassified Streptomyces TaxID=2593676 RepID=UPI0036FED948